MVKYIKVEDRVWENSETFESLTYPTVTQAKEVIAPIVHVDGSYYVVSGDLDDYFGKIYIDGEVYNNPNEVIT